MDVLIVAVIVGFATWYLIRTFYAKWKKVDEGCSCSSCGSCTACCPVIREDRHHSAGN
ncbi:MAG: FeoB-associated Cys-rich membrane protein [Deltaproteobacteria bacterium]|nr:FeoB-associated Cys-rich membrane protein [Deltaproteobacteria bacterium]MBW2596178.1 FeoB-associated Cys-rich membrane protein [Deltaproteobacteria bacterium]